MSEREALSDEQCDAIFRESATSALRMDPTPYDRALIRAGYRAGRAHSAVKCENVDNGFPACPGVAAPAHSAAEPVAWMVERLGSAAANFYTSKMDALESVRGDGSDAVISPLYAQSTASGGQGKDK